MKKIIVLFILIILCISIQAQFYLRSDFYKYHERADSTVEFPNWSTPQKDSIWITIKIDSLVEIGNDKIISYKLNKIIDRSGGIEDGDIWAGVLWAATDNNGTSVKLVNIQYESGIVIFIILYKNIEYAYQCRHHYKPKSLII